MSLVTVPPRTPPAASRRLDRRFPDWRDRHPNRRIGYRRCEVPGGGSTCGTWGLRVISPALARGADCPPWSRQALKASCWRLPACAVSPRPCLVTRTPWRAPHARPPPGASLALELSRGARVRQYARPADAEAVAACLARSPAIKPPASQAFSLALFRGTGAARTPSSGRRLFSCPGRLACVFACVRPCVPSIGCNTCILLAGYDIHAVPTLAVPSVSGSRSSRWLRRPSGCGRRCCGQTATRPHQPAIGQALQNWRAQLRVFRPRPTVTSL